MRHGQTDQEHRHAKGRAGRTLRIDSPENGLPVLGHCDAGDQPWFRPDNDRHVHRSLPSSSSDTSATTAFAQAVMTLTGDGWTTTTIPCTVRPPCSQTATWANPPRDCFGIVHPFHPATRDAGTTGHLGDHVEVGTGA